MSICDKPLPEPRAMDQIGETRMDARCRSLKARVTLANSPHPIHGNIFPSGIRKEVPKSLSGERTGGV